MRSWRRERFRINLMAHGQWNWKMAKLPGHSKSNGASSRPPESICKGETRRLIGYLRVGVLFSTPLQPTQTRLSAVSVVFYNDGDFGRSRKGVAFLGVCCV